MVQDKSYRKGAASLYVVIFTTLLLGIITLSFIRIMLSEASQTSNSDISQSAYDSALAGVEDAKIALLRYNQCLSDGYVADASAGDDTCPKVISLMQTDNSCDIVRKILGRPGNPDDDTNETIIQSEESTGGKTGEELQQAYTCVTISEANPDYLGTLNDNYRTKIVPIRSDKLNDIKSIRFQWFTNENGDPTSNYPNNANNGSLNKVGYTDNNSGWLKPKPTTAPSTATPPTMVLDLIQTSPTFTLAQLNNNAGANTNRGTLMLYPAVNGVTSIGNSESAGFAASADKSPSNPIAVKCNNNSTYRCSVDVSLPAPVGNSGATIVRNDGSTFLRITAPYGTPETDFSITLLDGGGNSLNFVGVQAKIDSTGRANDFFRRVESRVELVDVYYPFPEFAVTLNGDGETLNKNFWVTTNPWGGGSTSGKAD